MHIVRDGVLSRITQDLSWTGNPMQCCTIDGTDRLFSRHAKRYARRFRSRGIDRAQRCIVVGLEKFGVEGRSVLEIGCGVGGLYLSLLKKGARSAFGVDVSGGMIARAKELASECGVGERVSYCQGDFVVVNGNVPSADIVVMDKVLCCYADAKTLIEQSVAKTVALYVVSYPRDGWLARIGFRTSERIGGLLRWSFHPFFHEPAELEEMIREQGLDEVHSETTAIWQIKVFQRRGNVRLKNQ